MENLEVRFFKKDLVGFGLIYFVFTILCVVMFVIGYNFALSLIFAIFLFITSIMVILSTCLFRIRVIGDNFKVRTKFGQKYEFSISDIQKIKYIKHNNIKRGPQYALVITAGNKELELNKQMEGFDIMVEYLLKKYADDNGFKNIVFYVDDGISGTTFERDGFQAMMSDIESGKVGTVITKDLSRLGRDYLKTGEYVEIIFPDHDVRYIAINDNVDTFKGDNEFMAFKNIFNDWYARDCSKKIRAVFKAKGQSGKHLCPPVYGYKKSDTDKNLWVIDDTAAEVVRKIFRLCIEGYGPVQIARILTEQGVPTPTAYALSQGRNNGRHNAKLHRWGANTICHILERLEYCGHTVNFRTHMKSYKVHKIVYNPQDEWQIFKNTQEPIITQQEFDLVQELRKNKRRPQKMQTVNPFAGMVYCADCGEKMYLSRRKNERPEQEHMRCSTYAKEQDKCTVHYIRTCVLNEIVLGELNKLLETIKENEEEFINSAMNHSIEKKSSELTKAKKTIKQAEKRIAELDKLFTRLYEDNVLGKISDERFTVMSAGYENEQKMLKATVSELRTIIAHAEKQASDVTAFLKAVHKYEHITKLTPEIMHELIEKIVVHEADKSSGKRVQQIDIYYRFDVAVSSVTAETGKYGKKTA